MALDAQWSAVARGYRNALILAGGLGVAAIVAAVVAGSPLVGVFLCVGLVLGGFNARKLWTDTQSLDAAAANPRGAVMRTSLSRLGIITVFAILVALVYRPDGWAVFVGLVVFQLVMMSVLLGPLRRVVAR
ncbi:MAG TPA: hypothetical protein VME70_13170 [Mycobacteriales bacterium]|nr:hypothetical protein [Mycobacteriales bacterium]